EVVADEGAFLPAQFSPRQQVLERRKLARGGVLDQLVDAELPGAERGSGRFPSRYPRDGEPGGAEHADADAVLDVKPFELHRVVADHADVDPVVGQDAVDVEADELHAAGEGGGAPWPWAGNATRT